MRYPVILEPVPAVKALPGYYYAHIPTLGLTTHGRGMEGALDAARDLATLWLEEKRARGEVIETPPDAVLTTVEVG